MIELILLALAVVLAAAATLDLLPGAAPDEVFERTEGKEKSPRAERRLF